MGGNVLRVYVILFLCFVPNKCDESSSESSLLFPRCPAHQSIVLAKNAVEQDYQDNLRHGDHVYNATSYWVEGDKIHGCICQVASKPCLRKCCGPGEVIAPEDDFNRTNRCVPATGGMKKSHLVDIVLDEERISPGMRLVREQKSKFGDWFTVFEGPECGDDEWNLMLLNPLEYPETDDHQLHENGTLWVRAHEFLPVGAFCMDHQAGVNSSDLVVIVCLRKLPPKEVDLWRRVGALLSVPFLAVTFVVYAIIPELRNIYGKTLMCYVFALLVAYSSLSLSELTTYGPQCVFTGEFTCFLQYFILHTYYFSTIISNSKIT